VGSSLFAQPLMLQAVPMEDADGAEVVSAPAEPAPQLNPRKPVAAATDYGSLEEPRPPRPAIMGTLSDHLSLLLRWYYRPEKQRAGEVFFPNA
jgi:excinuclease ABC subunit C